MALTPLQRIRYKTTLDQTLLPDSVILDLILANTDLYTNVWDFFATLADAFDYMAAALTTAAQGAGVVKSYTVGTTAVTYASTFSDAALYWRNRAGIGGGTITQRTITRADYPTTADDTEFGERVPEPQMP